jgi:hypothetical protein
MYDISNVLQFIFSEFINTIAFMACSVNANTSIYAVNTSIISDILMRELKDGEIKPLVYSHRAGKWQSQSDSEVCFQNSVLFITIFPAVILCEVTVFYLSYLSL